MDDTNKDILKLLKEDGRMSFTEIGDKLGISRVAVKKRVAKLEQEGIIRYILQENSLSRMWKCLI